MTLTDFIRNNIEQLLQEWEEFARVAQPDDADLDRRELRDWADALLRAIATEIHDPQSDADLERNSKRLWPSDAPEVSTAARTHAMDRLAQGFNLNQMVSEYRSLRTSVALLWQQHAESGEDHERQLVRFNEALDHALSESIRQYTTVVERARDLFAAALGHDLRSPLSSILNTAEAILRSSDELPSHHVQGAVRIRNATNRISKMIQDLLDFTHTRLGGRLPMRRRRTDVAEVCAALLDEIAATFPQAEIRLNCPADLYGDFDADRLGEMLSNLISNAVKYGRDGTPVTVTVAPTDGEICFTVHNDGEPIPKNLRRAIFEPLIRGGMQEPATPALGRPQAPAGADEGLGLGLYISKQIAEAHGGRISLTSTLGAGTTFEVRVPRGLDAG